MFTLLDLFFPALFVQWPIERPLSGLVMLTLFLMNLLQYPVNP